MKICDPLEARQEFKFMKYMNWGITLGVFILLILTLRLFLNLFFADLIAIAVVFCLYFFFLNKRIIAIKCNGCGKIIETNTPWVCGACGAKNRQVYDYPFVNHCVSKFCNYYEPKAYRCHHTGCGELIFLSDDKSEINVAQCLNMPDKPKQAEKKDKHAEEVAKEQKGVKIAELKVQRAELEVKLKGFNASLEPPKLKTKAERLRSGLHNRKELDEEVRRLKAEADKEFAGNDAELKKRYLDIEAEARELLF